MAFHHPQKEIEIPRLHMDKIPLEYVTNFNFLGLTIDSNLSWAPHIAKVSAKINRTIGIINKFKHFLPLNIKISLYNALILPHLNYNLILIWQNDLNKFKNGQFNLLQPQNIMQTLIHCLKCSKY